METKYGYSGFQERFNRYKNNSFNSKINAFNSLITVARVKDIVLDDTFPDFENIGGWNKIGSIITYEDSSLIPPLDPNIKKLPLKNEIIYIINRLNINGEEINSSIPNYYYITTLGIWNHPHHNAYPFTSGDSPLSQNQINDYLNSVSGSIRRVKDQSTEINLGKTFKERGNIHPLLPFEGDVIIEGRWGNSIRFGSTVNSVYNNWSKSGEEGDPITIIRNGQGKILINPKDNQNITEQGWIPIVENINNDDSSIYLTSTQKVPIDVSSKSYESYSQNPPTLPSEYEGKQIIIDSGRLVFNSWEDHILLSSAKSINLNSKESVNIDTKEFITQADKIFLGKKELANEPLLLGNATVKFLNTLIDSLSSLTNTLKELQSTPVVNGSPASFPKLNIEAVKLSSVLDSLKKQVGENSILTSKRNFTL